MSDKKTETVRVLVADAVSPKGIELLESTPGFEVSVQTGMSPGDLAGIIGEYDALIVRSATKVTPEVLASPGKLRAIGRAGTGVDNIDLPAATRAGVVVVNTPGGNSVAAAELTLSLLLALARNVPQANADLREGRWERKKYMGMEVDGKTLGVVGLGRIGREVARRARGLRMEVIGYDPFVPAAVAEDNGIEFVTLEDLVPRADFLTLHLPVSAETKHLIDADVLARMKPSASVINCARGGLVDEAALYEAIEAGKLGGAALDVFETEPPEDRRLVEHPKVVSTPHLGASTREAQERVGTEIAAKIRDYLQEGVILDAVNFPAIGREEYATLGPVMDLAERMGAFAAQIAEGGVQKLEVETLGNFTESPLKPLVMAATKGLLTPIVEGGVSYINAPQLASERGITVEEKRSSEASPFAGLLTLRVTTAEGTSVVRGTLFGADRPRVVEVDGVAIESRPDGEMLFFRNRDVPGVVGRIGTILGGAKINIAGIQLGRPRGGDQAVSIICVDSPVPENALESIRAMDEILFARSISV